MLLVHWFENITLFLIYKSPLADRIMVINDVLTCWHCLVVSHILFLKPFLSYFIYRPFICICQYIHVICITWNLFSGHSTQLLLLEHVLYFENNVYVLQVQEISCADSMVPIFSFYFLCINNLNIEILQWCKAWIFQHISSENCPHY